MSTCPAGSFDRIRASCRAPAAGRRSPRDGSVDVACADRWEAELRPQMAPQHLDSEPISIPIPNTTHVVRGHVIEFAAAAAAIEPPTPALHIEHKSDPTPEFFVKVRPRRRRTRARWSRRHDETNNRRDQRPLESLVKPLVIRIASAPPRMRRPLQATTREGRACRPCMLRRRESIQLSAVRRTLAGKTTRADSRRRTPSTGRSSSVRVWLGLVPHLDPARPLRSARPQRCPAPR